MPTRCQLDYKDNDHDSNGEDDNAEKEEADSIGIRAYCHWSATLSPPFNTGQPAWPITATCVHWPIDPQTKEEEKVPFGRENFFSPKKQQKTAFFGGHDSRVS